MKKVITILLVLILTLSVTPTVFAAETTIPPRPKKVVEETTETTKVVKVVSDFTAPPISNPYFDVDENTGHYDAIMWCYLQRIMVGYGDGHFNPDAAISRAEFAQMIYNTLCTIPCTYPCLELHFGNLRYNPSQKFDELFFGDVPAEHWSYRAVQFVAQHTDALSTTECDTAVFRGNDPIDGRTVCEWLAAFGGTCVFEAETITRAEAAAIIMHVIHG